nr:lytic transglycosylase domain-containing protein [Fulvivirga sedimenti]
MILLAVAFTASAQLDSVIFYPESDLEYIPADADYELIEDRLSCIENEIPLNYNERVHAFVNYFAVKDRDYMRMVLKRKEVYFPLFEKYLKKYGLPEELKYLSIVESGLNPTAISPARAVGLWQFMPTTGRYFGLYQDWFIDERMDPEKSTEAACKYLKQLYGMFGDWELAISAYNTGPGNVRKAIRRSGYKNTFWDIYPYLHRETRSYLPQFVAIMYVVNYAHEHNYLIEDAQFAWETDTVMVKKYVHLETLASQLNLCLEDLQTANPSLRYPMVPDNTRGYALVLPAASKQRLLAADYSILDSAGRVGKEEMQKLAQASPGSTYGREKIVYRVRSGDVLGTIAQRHGVRVSDIKKWNNLSSNTIRIGQRLNLYVRGSGASVASTAPVIKTKSDGTKTYVVQPGDTLWDISRKVSGVTIESLKELNSLQGNNIKPGQELIISR